LKQVCLQTAGENRQRGSRGDLVRQIVPESTAGNWEGTVTHGDKPRWPDRQCTGRCRTQEPAIGAIDRQHTCSSNNASIRSSADLIRYADRPKGFVNKTWTAQHRYSRPYR